MTRANLLHALEILNGGDYSSGSRRNAADAITAALAQPEHIPLAYGVRQKGATHIQYFTHSKEAALKAMEKTPNFEAVALYAAPPAPDTLTQSTHAAEVSKYHAEIDRLREDLDEITLYRDRLDAQRWREWMDIFDEGFASWTDELRAVVGREQFTAAIDNAIATGGQS